MVLNQSRQCIQTSSNVRRMTLTVAVFLLIAPALKAQQQQQELVVLNSPTISITPATAEGRTLVYVRNIKDGPINVALAASIAGAKPVGTFSLAAETDQGAGTQVLESTIDKEKVLKVWVIARDVWEAGDFEADLTNGGTSLKKIRISRPAINVKVDGPTPDKAEILLTDGQVTSFGLKNDDATPYRFLWKLWIKGTETCAGTIDLGAKGVDLVRCTPTAGLGFSRVGELFKPETTEGNLLALYPEAADQKTRTTALKTFPVKASLSYFSPFWSQVLSYLVIVAVLILGGLTSLLLSQALPNRLQRIKLEEQIDALAKSTADLSSHVDSKLQVLLRLERSRLRDLLFSRRTWSPDFKGITDTCSEGLTRLGLRIGLSAQMDVVLRRLANLVQGGIPPQQIDQIENNVATAAILVGKTSPTDKDFESAQASITNAAALIDRANQPDSAFGQELAQRALSVKADIATNFKTKNAVFDRVIQAVPGPDTLLTNIPAATTEIATGSFKDVDLAIEKMFLIRRYVLRAEAVKNNADALKRLTDQEADLIKQLLTNNWHGLSAARLLVREMEDDVYADRIGELLNDTEAAIDIDPKIAYEGSPLELCVRFRNDALNSAAAREEWVCSWDFGDGLKETGWTVSHYFQSAKPKYTVSTSFQHKATGKTADAAGNPFKLNKDIEVRSRASRGIIEGRVWAEGLKLAAALLIAVFGLVAGARDQLTKLDILPGLVAVFLVGFGADTIKNLLTAKT